MKKAGAGNAVQGQQDYWFEQGWSFSLLRRYTIPMLSTITIVFDVTPCACTRIYFNPIAWESTGGPLLIDYWLGTDADSDGTVQLPFNRNAESPITPEAIIQLNPTINTIGIFDYINSLLPATNKVGADSAGGQPVKINKLFKYAATVQNTLNQAVIAQIDATWFEIP